MMRTFHRVHLSPWSSRRESIGLMGAFLMFMIGMPSHSEVMVESAKHMVRQLIQLVLVFLGLATPMPQTPATVATLAKPPVHHKHAFVDPNSMLLRSDPNLLRYNYIFKGTATLGGQPCAKASVLVRLLAGEKTVAKGTVTEEDGSYSLEVAIDAEDRAPVDWVMEAYTADFKKVELAGRRIVQREEEQDQIEEPEPNKDPIIVTNPVEFVVSFSK